MDTTQWKFRCDGRCTEEISSTISIQKSGNRIRYIDVTRGYLHQAYHILEISHEKGYSHHRSKLRNGERCSSCIDTKRTYRLYPS